MWINSRIRVSKQGVTNNISFYACVDLSSLRLVYTYACSLYLVSVFRELIKSKRPVFHLHFSVTYILRKYLIVSKTLDKMLNFQYIPKLIICHASFRSNYTKQRHTLWIRISSFKCVTGYISAYHGLKSGSEMRRTCMAKHCQIFDFKESHCITNVANSTQPGIPGSTMKNIWRWHQEDACVVRCSLSGFPHSHTKGNTVFPFSCQHETAQSSGWLSQHRMRLLWLPISPKMVRRR